MAEPAYSFTIPSVHDDLPLDCRVYHPKHFDKVLLRASEDGHAVPGAVIAHPYAPMGGCYDDPVVLSVTKCLLKEGYMVGTFNFRGSQDSKGSTSWTGRAEREDYISFAGFMIYYIKRVQPPQRDTSRLSTIPSISSGLTELENRAANEENESRPDNLNLLLVGYSYGSIILSRLPPIATLIQRFETSERGTAYAEIILRARRLARETEETTSLSPQTLRGRRGRQTGSTDAGTIPYTHRTPHSPVVVGGEETDPSERRRSRDSARSVSLVRKGVEVPHRIKAHIRRRSSGQQHSSQADEGEYSPRVRAVNAKFGGDDATPPSVAVRYLLISPLLPPITHALVSPPTFSALLGTSKGVIDRTTGVGSLQHRVLAVWGASDPFTSNRRLKAWSEKVASQAQGSSYWNWAEIENGGHFWREQSALQGLLEKITDWLGASNAPA